MALLRFNLMATVIETLAFTFRKYVAQQSMNVQALTEKHQLLWSQSSFFTLEYNSIENDIF